MKIEHIVTKLMNKNIQDPKDNTKNQIFLYSPENKSFIVSLSAAIMKSKDVILTLRPSKI